MCLIIVHLKPVQMPISGYILTFFAITSSTKSYYFTEITIAEKKLQNLALKIHRDIGQPIGKIPYCDK